MFGDATTGTGSPVTHTYSSQGSYTLTVTVTDADSVSLTKTLNIIVSPGLTVSLACPAAGVVGVQVTCNVTGSGGASPYTYSWKVDGAVQIGQTSSSLATTFTTAGPHLVESTVIDANTVSVSQSATVQVAPVPLTGPTAVFTISETPKWQNPPDDDTIVGVGTVIVFDPRGSSDPTGTIVKYVWNFGDGSAIVTSTTNKPMNHVFKIDGSYTITLTVTDNHGLQGSTSKTLTVRPSPVLLNVSYNNKLDDEQNGRFKQTWKVTVYNPNKFSEYVNIVINGISNTGATFTVSSGPVSLAAGQTKTIVLRYAFSDLFEGMTWRFTTNLSFGFNSNPSTYVLAASKTGTFRIED